MNYLNGKTVLKGDAVVYITPDNYAVAGTVHECYERNLSVRISGYALPVPANKVLLAADAYAAIAVPLAEAAAKAEAEKNAGPPPVV